MSADTDRLEHDLIHDLEGLVDDLADDSLAEELYRGLANTRWRRPHSGEGHVTVSWRRAEEIVNGLREQGGRAPLTLAQTGGEGEVSDRVAKALQEKGWSAKGEDTGRHDDRHADRPPDAPPTDQRAGNPELERAHEQADAQQRRRG